MNIIPILIGGFGNRLYQLANAFRLRDKYGMKLKLYSIDPLPSNVDSYSSLGVVRPEDFADFGGHELLRVKGLPQTMNEIFPTLHFERTSLGKIEYDGICKEGYAIDSDFHTMVVGYFFGYSNIKDYIHELRRCFNPIIDNIMTVPPNTLGIHLRLGISTDNYECRKLNLEYYEILAKEDYNQCFVFTDNPAKARDFPLDFKNVTIIENNPMYLDMLMLSQCSIIGMASSTLSAWSAYFSKGKVYTPKGWLRQHSDDVPKNWIII